MYKSKHKHLHPHKKGVLSQYDIKNRIAYSTDFQRKQNFRSFKIYFCIDDTNIKRNPLNQACAQKSRE